MSRIGVVAALPMEAAALRGLPIAVVQSGMGAERAGAAALRLAIAGAAGLVSWGLAGGIAPHLRAGDLLLPESIVAADGERLDCDPEWRARIATALRRGSPVHDGAILDSPVVLRNAAAKASAWTRGVVAVDQESAAVARVARARGLPFVAIRAVCDPADFALPHAAIAAVSTDGRLRPFALLAALLRHPGELGELSRLRGMSNAALRTLREVALRCKPDLRFT